MSIYVSGLDCCAVSAAALVTDDRSIPRYARVASALRAAIAAGIHPPGSTLPSERELMSAFGVSRGTARQAIRLLIDDGVATVRRGARPVVLAVPGQPEQSLAELVSFSTWARSTGRIPSGRAVSLTRRPATQVDVDRLGATVGEPVWELVRVRLLDGRAVMVERSTYPHSVGLVVAGIDLDRNSINEGLRRHGVVYARARHSIDAVPADADDAALLGVGIGEPLLRVRRSGTSLDGRPIEWGEDRYVGNAVAFVVENTARSPALRRAAPNPDAPDGTSLRS